MESESWTGGTGLIYLSIPGAASVLGEPVQGSPICPGAALKTRTAEASAALGGWVGAGAAARGAQGDPAVCHQSPQWEQAQAQADGGKPLGAGLFQDTPLGKDP